MKGTFSKIIKNPDCSAEEMYFVQTKYTSSHYEKLGFFFLLKSQKTKETQLHSKSFCLLLLCKNSVSNYRAQLYYLKSEAEKHL